MKKFARFINSFVLSFAAIALFSVSSLAAPKHLTILYFSDFHGALESPRESGGGAARIATIVRGVEKENREKGAETLVLFGGDAITGSVISSEFKGEAEHKFLSALDLDAMVLGNHEFDNGVARLEELKSSDKFPTVAANVYRTDSNERLVSPWVVTGSEIPVAILGLTLDTTKKTTLPENVKGVSFEDPIKEAKKDLKAVSKLATVRIALTHLGVKGDVALAKELRGFSAVVGGHDHVKPEENCRTVNDMPVCQTPAFGQYVGRLDFSVDGKKVAFEGSSLLPVDKGVAPDPEIEKIVAPYEKKVRALYSKPVARATEDLIPQRTEFTKIGALVTDAIKKQCGTELAVMNSGGIRAPLRKGPVLLSNMMELLPYKNELVIVKMSGKEIEAALENSARQRLTLRGMLYASGLSYSTDGEKVVNPTIKGKPLDPSRDYDVCTVDYLAKGGDGYTSIRDAKDKKPLGKYLLDSVVAEFKKKKAIP